MIPYEELVAALARWRARRGLPTGLGDYLGEPPVAAAAYDYSPPVVDHSGDDVVELHDELLDGSIDEPVPGVYAQDIALGEPLDDGDDPGAPLPSRDAMDVEDFGPMAAEETRPAGLAGLVSSGLDDEAGQGPSDRDPGTAAAPPSPPARGRSRKRKR
ncbi:MAG TPA: hypothetical protein VK698_30950 [Kofleriaceae bacterium]|nr:hypothetical protein [Kofleriaceae bacterium]